MFFVALQIANTPQRNNVKGAPYRALRKKRDMHIIYTRFI